MDDKFELVLLRNGKKVFEAILLAEIITSADESEPYTAINYDEASFAILSVDEEHKSAIKNIIRLFYELWDELEEVYSDG